MKRISYIIPAHNEEENIYPMYQALLTVIHTIPSYDYEILFIDDGSTDRTLENITTIATQDPRVRIISFTRNFGKEIATTAGIHTSTGDAVIMIDADLQHPVICIPEFIKKWEEGFDVVVGVRTKNNNEGVVKRWGSQFHHAIMRRISELETIQGETDYRLIDRAVVDSFHKFTERYRMTRALINWLGFKRSYVYFEAHKRAYGESSYSFLKLFHLATHSFVSHSLFPLRLVGYLGVTISAFSGLLGIVIIFEQHIFRDIWNWNISGTAQFVVLTVFLVGIILMSLGLIAIYIGNINNETRNRPLYVVRKLHSHEHKR